MTQQEVAVIVLRVMALVMGAAAFAALPLLLMILGFLVYQMLFGYGSEGTLGIALATMGLLSAATLLIAWWFWRRPASFTALDVAEEHGGEDRRIADLLAAAVTIYGGMLLLTPLRDAMAEWYRFPERAPLFRGVSDVADTFRHAKILRDLTLALLFLFAGKQVVRLMLRLKTPRPSSVDGDSGQE